MKSGIIESNENQNEMCNRTLIVDPSFCGKACLLMNKLKFKNPDTKIKFICGSPEQYSNCDIDLELDLDFEQKTILNYENRTIIFDHMLDSNQKLIDPFFYSW